MAVDALAEQADNPVWKKKFKGLVTGLTLAPDVLLLKPMTFMNLSGEAVADAIHFYKLEAKNVIVFHDDLDLMPAQVKIKQGGGSGGHNGLKSLDSHITPNYWRIRLGIGHPGERGDEVTNYVLGTFAKADKAWIDLLLEALVGNFKLMLEGKTSDYLGSVNRKVTAGLKA